MTSDTITTPNSETAEGMLIGSVIIDNSLLPQLSDIKPSDFYINRNRLIWEAIDTLSKRGAAVDTFTLEQVLGPERWKAVGGLAYLGQLVADVPSAYNAPDYARAVTDAAYCRAALSWAGELAKEAYRVDVRALEKRVNEAPRTLVSRAPAPDDTADVFLQLTEEINDPAALTASYISTGWANVNHIMGGGWRRTDLAIVAARPGMGKTAFVLQAAIAAARHGKRVVFFSLEMSKKQLYARAIAQEAGFDWLAHKRGASNEEQRQRAKDALSALMDLPLTIYDQPMTTAQARAIIGKLSAEGTVDLVVADHLRLFNDTGERETTRLGSISWALKQLAKQSGAAVIAAAQINRGNERRDNKRPTLSDIRESGEVEENADVVLGLYRAAYYGDNDTTAEVLPMKARDGSTDKPATLYFDAPSTAFRQIAA